MTLSRTDIKKRKLIPYFHPDSLISEQLRMIHTNIKFSVAAKKNGIFLITSPNINEGKSSTAANLAVTMAQQKEKVLLIDANLRSPSIHSFFKIPNTFGLTDVLTGRISFDDVVKHIEIGRLDILSSGAIPINPVELLGSEMMQELLKTVKQTYDTILIDSHSVIEVTDTKLLANQCDGVILVIKNGKTICQKAIYAKKELEFSKAKIIGVILNE